MSEADGANLELQKKHEELIEKFKTVFGKLKESLSENQRLRLEIESLSKKAAEGESSQENGEETISKLRSSIAELQEQLALSQKAASEARLSQAQASALQVQATAQAQSSKEQYERERSEHQQAENSLQRSYEALEASEVKRKEAERALSSTEKALAQKIESTSSEIEKLKARISELSSTCDSQSAKIVELTPAADKLRARLKDADEGVSGLTEKLRIAQNDVSEANARTSLAEKKAVAAQNEVQTINAKLSSIASDLVKEKKERETECKEYESKLSALRDSLTEQKAASGASVQLQERAKALALASAQRLRALQAELAEKDAPPVMAVVMSVVDLPQRLVTLAVNASDTTASAAATLSVKGASSSSSSSSSSLSATRWALVLRFDRKQKEGGGGGGDEDEDALNVASSATGGSTSSSGSLSSRLEWISMDSLPKGYLDVLQSSSSSAASARILSATESAAKDIILSTVAPSALNAFSIVETLQLAFLVGSRGSQESDSTNVVNNIGSSSGKNPATTSSLPSTNNNTSSLSASASLTRILKKLSSEISSVSSIASEDRKSLIKSHEEAVSALTAESASVREEFAKYKLRAAATMRVLEDKVKGGGGGDTNSSPTTLSSSQKPISSPQANSSFVPTPMSPSSSDGGSGGTRIVELSEALEAETVARTSSERRCAVLTERLNLMQGRLSENETSLETLRAELQAAAARYADDLETGGVVEEKTRLIEEAESRARDSEVARSKLGALIPGLEAEIKTLKMRLSDVEASLVSANSSLEQQKRLVSTSSSSTSSSATGAAAATAATSQTISPSTVMETQAAISLSPFVIPHLSDIDEVMQQQQQQVQPHLSKLPVVVSSSSSLSSSLQPSRPEQLSSDALLELLISGNGVTSSSNVNSNNNNYPNRSSTATPPSLLLQRPSTSSSRRSVAGGGVAKNSSSSSSSSSSSVAGAGVLSGVEESNGSPVHSRAGTRANSLMGSPGSANIALLPHNLAARPLATVHSSGRLSRDEDDFEEDELGAAGTEDVLALQYAELLRELKEARDLLSLQAKQLDVLKETVRESERASARMAVLSPTSPNTSSSSSSSSQLTTDSLLNGGKATSSTPLAGRENSYSSSFSPSSVAAVSTSLTYLKNAVVAYMIAEGNAEKKRMLPAISMLLKLSPSEVEKISACLDGISSSASSGSNSGMFSSFFSSSRK